MVDLLVRTQNARLLCPMEPDIQRELSRSRRMCVLVYDGECRLCVFAKAKMEQVGIGQPDSDVRFLPYQSEEAADMLGASYRSGRPDMALLIQPTGEVLQGVDAFRPVLQHLRGGRLLLRGLRFPVARWLAEWGYRMIARHRYRWFGETRPVRPCK